MLSFEEHKALTSLAEGRTATDNSMVAVLSRLEYSSPLDAQGLPCWCGIGDRHLSWCLKLRAGFEEFKKFSTRLGAAARMNRIFNTNTHTNEW